MRDLASVAPLVIWERLVSHRYSSGTSLQKAPSAAALAYSSASSLPELPLCTATQRMVTSLSLLRIREQTSVDEIAKRCPGPMVPDLTQSIATVEPRCKRPPVHPPGPGLRHTHAATTSPLSNCEPSVQTVFRRLHSFAVWRAALSSTIIQPGKRRWMPHSCGSTVSRAQGCRRLEARGEGGLPLIKIFSGPSPSRGLAYRRWVSLACLWSKSALAALCAAYNQ